MPTRTLSHLTQTHLCAVLLDRENHNPLRRMPVYAELGLVETRDPYVIGREELHLHGNIPEEILAVVRSTVARLVDEERFRRLSSDERDRLAETILAHLHDRQPELLQGSPERQAALVEEAVRRALRRHEIPIGEGPKPIVYAYPLGFLTTDHVGYVSYDLTRTGETILARLPGDRRVSIDWAFFLYPMGEESRRIDVLEQGRFTREAVYAKVAIDAPIFTPGLKALSLPSMQKPSLVDWYFSPGSFAVQPKMLVGESGCETMLPASLPLHEFVFRQIVRLSAPPAGVVIPAPYKFGYADEYRATWQSLGHSLGEILYTLPLAPGEQVSLAVIDWSFDATQKRDEATTLDERLFHETRRDRTIVETVAASLDEWQRGGSFMGGVAGSYGSSSSSADSGTGLGISGSMGGAYATTSGSRDLAAENVQRLSDRFAQVSAARRELHSTVVVQARQEQKENIQTRTFANYNRSHTLTILYYEILRHFRVDVQWIRRRPVVLKQYAPVDFEKNENILQHRRVLEAALLDPTLKAGLDAVAKYELTKRHYELSGINADNPARPEKPFSEGDILFTAFEVGVKTAEGLKDKTDELVMLNLILHEPGHKIGRPLVKAFEKGSEEDNINVGERLNDTAMGWFIVKPHAPIRWRDLIGFEFVLHDSDEWRMDRLQINGFHQGGVIDLIPNADVDYFFPENGGSNTATFIKRPGPDVPWPPAPPPLKNVLNAEEQMIVTALRKHLVDHAGHYNRAIVLSRDADTVAIEFQKSPWTGTTSLLDHAQPYALEVFGDYVAFPMTSLPEVDANLIDELYTAIHGNDPARHAWVIEKLATLSKQELEQLGDRLAQARAHAEKLITLPARGVFAEGKLGHCNLSEEIDETRFWRWGEHKLPFEAPKIDAVHPITPTPQGVTATPTSFPASLVNIVNPTAAPDPTGLAAALKVLQTPDIFRDMSAKAEVAKLLEDLIGGTIDIAEAANRARNIKAAGDHESGGTSGPGSTGRGGGWDAGGGRALPSGGQGGHGGEGSGTPSGASPSRRDSPREQLDQLQLYRSALRNGDISEEEYQQLASGYLFSNVKGGGGTPTTPPPTKVRQAFVDQIASIKFANGTDINNWFLAQTGKEFIDWFNATHAAKGFWADQYVRDPVTGAVVKDDQGHAKVLWSGRSIPNNATVKQHFVDFWDRIPLIYAPASQIGLIDFISLMAIGINEKSGDLVSLGEIGSLRYMFEAGTKSSYNGSPNRTAFDLFNDAKFNQAHDTKPLAAQHKNTTNVAWKGQVWPEGVPTSIDPAVTGYIREADFYKFRGRGIIQTTWRGAYVGLIDFVRAYTGPNATIQTFKTKWTAGVPADIATTSSNAEWDQLFGEIDFAAHAIAVHSNSKGGYLALAPVADDGANGGLNGHHDKAGTIRHIGRSIGWQSYGEIFYKRVVQMLNSLGNDPALTTGNTPAAGGTHI